MVITFCVCPISVYIFIGVTFKVAPFDPIFDFPFTMTRGAPQIHGNSLPRILWLTVRLFANIFFATIFLFSWLFGIWRILMVQNVTWCLMRPDLQKLDRHWEKLPSYETTFFQSTLIYCVFCNKHTWLYKSNSHQCNSTSIKVNEITVVFSLYFFEALLNKILNIFPIFCRYENFCLCIQTPFQFWGYLA